MRQEFCVGEEFAGVLCNEFELICCGKEYKRT